MTRTREDAGALNESEAPPNTLRRWTIPVFMSGALGLLTIGATWSLLPSDPSIRRFGEVTMLMQTGAFALALMLTFVVGVRAPSPARALIQRAWMACVWSALLPMTYIGVVAAMFFWLAPAVLSRRALEALGGLVVALTIGWALVCLAAIPLWWMQWLANAKKRIGRISGARHAAVGVAWSAVYALTVACGLRTVMLMTVDV